MLKPLNADETGSRTALCSMQQRPQASTLLVTADKNMHYQQNLTGRKVSIIVLGNAQWPVLRRYVDRVVAAVNAAMLGSYIELEIPFE